MAGLLNAGQAGNRTPNLPRIQNSTLELAPPPHFFREEFFFLLAPPSPPGFSFPFPLSNIGLTHFPRSWICIIPPARRDVGAAAAPEQTEQTMLRKTSEGKGRAEISQLWPLSPQIPPFFQGFLPLLPSCSFPRELPRFGNWVFHGASQDLPSSILILRFFLMFFFLSCLTPGLLQLPKAPVAAEGCWR